MITWIECKYCGNVWEGRIYSGDVPPCPKCKEKKALRVYKKGVNHNKYYADDPQPEDSIKIDYGHFED